MESNQQQCGATPSGTTFPRGFQSAESIHWPLVPAREIYELKYGKALVASTRGIGNIPVYGTNGQCGTHDEPLFTGPGVIIGRKGQGPLGVEWCDGDYWVIDTAYSLTPKRPDIDLRFSYYLIKYVGLNHLKDGTSNPSLSRDTFGAQAFPHPPVHEQRAIAYVLRTLDDKIELNRRMNSTLEAMARALFQSWFVDFDPVHRNIRRAQGLPVPETPIPGFDKKSAQALAEWDALFPAAFEASALGEIPKGWRITTIADLADVVGGSTPGTKEPVYWDEGTHHWATPKDLSALTFPVLLDTERRVTDAGLTQISSGLLPAGTVLLSSRAPIGYLAVAEVPVAINQGFIAMKPLAGISNLFLLLWTRSAHEEILSRANGSTFLEISKSNFRPICVTTPTAPVMEMFDTLVRPLYSRLVANERMTRNLAVLRDTLLPKLISGEVRVKDAERFVEATL